MNVRIPTNFVSANPQGLRDLESCILKLVLAVASITENNGHSEIGHRLFESVRGTADSMLHTEAIDVKGLPFLVLVVSVFPLIIMTSIFLCLYPTVYPTFG